MHKLRYKLWIFKINVLKRKVKSCPHEAFSKRSSGRTWLKNGSLLVSVTFIVYVIVEISSNCFKSKFETNIFLFCVRNLSWNAGWISSGDFSCSRPQLHRESEATTRISFAFRSCYDESEMRRKYKK